MTENYVQNTDPGAGTLCEGSRSGRCPVVQQRRPGRHPITAKRKWNKELNVAVMECYFLSDPVDINGRPIRGYRQRMHQIWQERGMFTISEQNLCDQARAIRKNEWLSVVELEMIKRTVCDNEVDESVESSINDTINDEINNVPVAQQVDTPPEVVVISNSPVRSDEQKQMLNEIIEIMTNNDKMLFPGFKKVDRKRLADLTQQVNEVISDVRTNTITETNNLIFAVSVYVAKKLGIRSSSAGKKDTKEPWWKRRMKLSINEIRKHINMFERKKNSEKINKPKYMELERKYRVKTKGLNVVIEELKQRLLAKSHKLKRYEERSQQFRINRLFNQDQKKVYYELNG